MDLKLDLNKGSSNYGDLYMSGGDFDKINDTDNLLEIVRQRCVITMETNRGEFYLDEDFGIPWMSFMIKNPDEFLLQLEINEALKARQGVKRVIDNSIELTDDVRELTYSFSVLTDNGQTGV